MGPSIFLAAPPTIPTDLPPIMPIEIDVSSLERKISEKWGISAFSIEKEQPFWEEGESVLFLEKEGVSFFRFLGKSIYGGACIPENLLLDLLSRMTNLDISAVDKALLEPFYTTMVLHLKEFLKETSSETTEIDLLGGLPDKERAGSFLICPFKITLDEEHLFEIILFFPEASVREAQKNVWRHDVWKGVVRKDVSLELSLELGCVYLNPSEWDAVSEGDFILPDLLMWNPESDKYKVRISYLNQALFRARLKRNGTLKILDRGVDWKLFHGAPQEKEREGDGMLEEEQVDEEMDFAEGLEEEGEVIEEENATSSSEEESFQESVEETDISDEEGEEEEPYLEEVDVIEKVSFNEIPVQIRFEVGRIELPIEKIEALAPGEILRVDQSVLGQVQMVVGNRIVGLGEVVSFQGKPAIRVLRFG